MASPLPINGLISFYGNPVQYNSGSLAMATAITNFGHVTVLPGQESGVYTNVPGGAAAFWSPFTFNPPASAVVPLWSITNNGVIYSFDSTSMSVVSQDSNALNLQGTGIAHVTGYADTPGTWNLALSANTLSFLAPISVNVTNVPVLHNVIRTNGSITFNWNALPGQPYQVEYCSNLSSSSWQNLGASITTTNSNATASDAIVTGQQRLYRVRLLP